MRLTEISIRSLKPSEQYVTHFDDTTPGFGVRVGKRSKTFVALRGRSRERLTIGRYPDMSLAEARAEAKRLLSAEPDAKPTAVKWSTARDLFLEQNYRDKRPSSKREIKRLLEKHFKTLDHQALSDLTDAHITKVLDRLASTPSEQLHAYRAARTFLRWCTRPPRRYIRHSPMEGYEPPSKDRKGDRILADEELKAVWIAAGPSNRRYLGIFRLYMLWGTRRGETALLDRKWALDGVLTIPGSVTKNHRDHAIPILPLAQATLDACHGLGGHYFPAQNGDGPMNPNSIANLTKELQKLSGTKDWSPHDLRRTFRSNMARLRVPRDVCEMLLNHAPSQLDEIYDRYSYLDEKREALAKYENFIHTLTARA